MGLEDMLSMVCRALNGGIDQRCQVFLVVPVVVLVESVELPTKPK